MTILSNRSLMRTIAPASEPLTLSEAKSYLRIDNTHEDILIGDLIVASRMMAEHWLKRSLITQTWKLSYDDYVCDEVPLPMGPVSSISSVIVFNRDGSSQTIDPDVYVLNAAKNTILLDTALFGFRIEITYITGYGNSTAVPKPIKQGMLAHIASMYDCRGESDDSSIPRQSVGLYMPFRELCL